MILKTDLTYCCKRSVKFINDTNSIFFLNSCLHDVCLPILAISLNKIPITRRYETIVSGEMLRSIWDKSFIPISGAL